MENGHLENGVCSSELVNGGRDIWSGNDSDSSSADHLVVMVHGILGRSDSFLLLLLLIIISIFDCFMILNFMEFWFLFSMID